VLGFYLPRIYVGQRKQARLQRFNDQIVDALTMIANSMRSGTSFLQAFDLVAHELPAPISEEFGQVVAEVSVGATIEESLDNLTKRIDSYDLYLVVSAILVQRQAGGKLAEVLDQIGHTVRERIRILRQVQVLTAQERASAVLVGALPIILLVILLAINPSYHGPFLATTLGRLIMGVGFAFEVFGFIVMNRLAKIDV
jgi:tight adherence protein B